MCVATQWLVIAAGLVVCLLIPNRSLAEDDLWQKTIREGMQLREQGRYAEAEKAYRLALAEAEKFGPEDRRLALSLNNLAVLFADQRRSHRS